MNTAVKTNRSNSKIVQEACDKHVKSFYENKADLVADYHAVNDDGQRLAEGGCFLISYSDQRGFIDSLRLNNNSGKEFDDQMVFDMYVILTGRAAKKIAEEA